jgi:hypothetical protein
MAEQAPTAVLAAGAHWFLCCTDSSYLDLSHLRLLRASVSAPCELGALTQLSGQALFGKVRDHSGGSQV